MLAKDHRALYWAYLFSEPVYRIRHAVKSAEADPATGLANTFELVDQTPKGSLFRALLLQLLLRLLEQRAPRQCEGCDAGSRTEDDSSARVKSGWKRSDARYHSRRCLKAAKERERRARLKLGSQPASETQVKSLDVV